jgi:hypothetical protein
VINLVQNPLNKEDIHHNSLAKLKEMGVVIDKQDTIDATMQLDLGPKEKMVTCKTDRQQRGLNHFR